MLPWRSPTPTFWLYERTKTSLGKHQKADDVGAAGWPRGPWWVGVVLCEGLGKGLWGHKAHSSKAKEKEWLPIITKQESTQGHEDQSSPRRKFVSLLPAHQKSEITDFFLATFLKNEVLKIIPTQKQTCSNQWTRFRAFITTGDYNSHAGLGVKCSKKVATAICGANILAKLSTVPVQRGYSGNKISKPHTVLCKLTGCCGFVLVSMISGPRGTGIVSAPVPQKLLLMAEADDYYISARGYNATLGNFAPVSFDAISKTYSYLPPDLWTLSRLYSLSLPTRNSLTILQKPIPESLSRALKLQQQL